MLEPLWVARLYVSEATAAKLSQRHQLNPDEVRLAIECVPGLLGERVHDRDRGTRMLVEVIIRRSRRSIPVLVVLYPVEDPLGDAYALGSAYPRQG